MFYYEAAPNQIVRADADTLTYSSEVELALGTIVEIPIGKKSAIGVVIQKTTKPNYATKPIIRALENKA